MCPSAEPGRWLPVACFLHGRSELPGLSMVSQPDLGAGGRSRQRLNANSPKRSTTDRSPDSADTIGRAQPNGSEHCVPLQTLLFCCVAGSREAPSSGTASQ